MRYDPPGRGANRHIALACCLLLVAAAAGCSGGYGPVSPAAFGYAKSLYTVSNVQAADAIAKVEASITADADAGQLSPDEVRWLLAICGDCRDGRWDDAQAAARRMMEDQVTR